MEGPSSVSRKMWMEASIHMSEQNVDKHMNEEVTSQEFTEIMERALGFQSS